MQQIKEAVRTADVEARFVQIQQCASNQWEFFEAQFNYEGMDLFAEIKGIRARTGTENRSEGGLIEFHVGPMH